MSTMRAIKTWNVLLPLRLPLMQNVQYLFRSNYMEIYLFLTGSMRFRVVKCGDYLKRQLQLQQLVRRRTLFMLFISIHIHFNRSFILYNNNKSTTTNTKWSFVNLFRFRSYKDFTICAVHGYSITQMQQCC